MVSKEEMRTLAIPSVQNRTFEAIEESGGEEMVEESRGILPPVRTSSKQYLGTELRWCGRGGESSDRERRSGSSVD